MELISSILFQDCEYLIPLFALFYTHLLNFDFELFHITYRNHKNELYFGLLYCLDKDGGGGVACPPPRM